MSDYKPDIDQANEGSMAGTLAAFLRSMLMEVDDMLPATVVSYDDATNRAVIKPLIMMGTTTGQKISRQSVPNIPVFRFGGGGFFIRFPIKPGDFGWLKANDRDISLMMQRGGMEDWPNTQRLHSFSDAMFFPDTLKEWAINGENADAMVIQSMDGSVCVALHEGRITMTAPQMDVEIPQTNWTGNINQLGNQTVVGNKTVTGDSISSGSMTHNGPFVLDGTEVNSHTHGGVDRGSSNTDPFGS